MKKAFTLAEVLVTLMIIGVIAAMTIPALRKNTEQRELATGCLKAYTTLSQVVDLTQQEIGPLSRWPWSDPDEILSELKPHLNINQDCGKSVACLNNPNYTEMNGAAGAWGAANTYVLKMADGSHMIFYTCTGDKAGPCGVDSYFQDPSDTVYASFFYDVNGDKKPNQFGYDIFLFNIIKNKGVLPAGTADSSGCTTGRGLSCTAKVIREGKIAY